MYNHGYGGGAYGGGGGGGGGGGEVPGYSAMAGKGQRGIVSYETSSKDPSMMRARLFVGGLNGTQVTREDVIDLFSNYGQLLGVTLFKGYAFVQYSNEGEADLAASALHRYYWRGGSLDIKCQGGKEPSTGGGGGGGGGGGMGAQARAYAPAPVAAPAPIPAPAASHSPYATSMVPVPAYAPQPPPTQYSMPRGAWPSSTYGSGGGGGGGDAGYGYRMNGGGGGAASYGKRPAPYEFFGEVPKKGRHQLGFPPKQDTASHQPQQGKQLSTTPSSQDTNEVADLFVCGMCRLVTNSLETFVNHRSAPCDTKTFAKSTDEPSRLGCNSCEEAFDSSWELLDHLSKVHSLTVYSRPQQQQGDGAAAVPAVEQPMEVK